MQVQFSRITGAKKRVALPILQQCEDQLEVAVTEAGGKGHHFAEGQQSGGPQV